jgi:hypothetical protein
LVLFAGGIRAPEELNPATAAAERHLAEQSPEKSEESFPTRAAHIRRPAPGAEQTFGIRFVLLAHGPYHLEHNTPNAGILCS